MGELIAVDSVKIIVLTDSVLYHVKFAEVIKLSEINHYTLRYAKPKHYGPLIPLYWLGSVFHGYYFVLTAPINILTTSIVTSTGEKAFTYNEKDLNFKKLKMFARFPQGLPPNIDINQIR